MRKHLVLRREALAEITAADLSAVVAGVEGTHLTCYTGITVCGLCDPHRQTH